MFRRDHDGPVLDATPADYCAVRSLTELLAEPLSAEDQTVQSMPDVSPTKWHRAHTTWFFETFVLSRFDPTYEPLEPAYRMLFNSYYEGVGPKYPRSQRGAITRPGIDEVAAYRRHVDAAMLDLLHDGAPAPPGRDRRARTAPRAAAPGAGAHGHQARPVVEPLAAGVPDRAGRPPPRPRPGWVDVDGGLVEVGHHGDGFCYDNELPRHRSFVHPFRIADGLITAGQWQAFIDDGGYQRPDLWLSDGWYAVQDNGWDAPLYWQRDGDCWLVHTLGGTRPVDDDEPVGHVSLFEADAFARWSGARLPTEQEWELAVATAARRPVAPVRPRLPAPVAARRPPPRRPAPGVRRVLAVDLVGLPAVPGLRPGARRGRRVQRQVHVRADGPARLRRRSPRPGTPGRRTATSSRRRRAGR